MLSGKRLPKASAGPNFASRLLSNEPQGFAIDATLGHTLGPAYVGGNYGGTVSVKDPTLANNLYNVPLNASNLVQSGTSPKMVLWGSSPYVRWTPHNYQIFSQQFDDANWTVAGGGGTVTADDTVAPDGSTTADLFHVTGAGGRIDGPNFSSVAGVPYTISVYAKRSAGTNWLELIWYDGTDSVRGWFNINTGAVGTATNLVGATGAAVSITSAGNGWYRCALTGILSVGGASSHIFIVPTSADASHASSVANDDQWFWGAQICRGYNANPYLVTTTAARIGIPQDYDTAVGQYGILAEPAATNLLLYSEKFDDAIWEKEANCNITANAVTAPDGSATADKHYATAAATSAASVRQLISYTSGTAYTVSVFAKAAGFDYFQIAWTTEAFPDAARLGRFNLTLGTVTATPSGGNATITAVGDGWYRCTVTQTADATATSYTQFVSLSADGTTTGDGSSGCYLWGAQLEEGTTSSSCIPTLGSTVTRAADNIGILTSTFPYANAAPGTQYAKFKPRDSAMGGTGFGIVCSLNDGTTNNRIELADGTSERIKHRIFNTAGAEVSADGSTALVDNTIYKVAQAFDTDDYAGYVNGGSDLTDATVSLPSGITRLDLGVRSNDLSATPLNGYIYQYAYYPRRMANAALGTLTT